MEEKEIMRSGSGVDLSLRSLFIHSNYYGYRWDKTFVYNLIKNCSNSTKKSSLSFPFMNFI